jgi:hypothetical protein
MPEWRLSACRAAAVLVLCAPLCACQRGNEQLDEAALGRQLRTLSSLAAEGAFLARELRAGHLSPSFASVHLDDLAEDTDKARSEIAKPAPSQLEPRHREAQALTEQLVQAWRTTAMARNGPDAPLQQREQAFRRLHDAFDALEGRR